mgnify:CR=1 FL=1
MINEALFYSRIEYEWESSYSVSLKTERNNLIEYLESYKLRFIQWASFIS